MTGLLDRVFAVSRAVDGLFGATIMILCGAAILALAVLLIVKRVINKPVAVIAQTVACCVLMIPIIWGLDNVAAARAAVAAGADGVRVTAAERDRRIADLEATIRHLESTGFNLEQFQKILELGLIETSLRQTVITKDLFDQSHRGAGFGGFYDWEYLGVMTTALTAKFGVDLKAVRLYRPASEPGTIMVYGITPKFLGVSDYVSAMEVSEVRKLILDRALRVTETQIDASNAAKDALRERENRMEADYRDRLNRGLETAFMDGTVERLAENFVRMILAPLEARVVFTDVDNLNARDLAGFLEGAMEEKRGELARLRGE